MAKDGILKTSWEKTGPVGNDGDDDDQSSDDHWESDEFEDIYDNPEEMELPPVGSGDQGNVNIHDSYHQNTEWNNNAANCDSNGHYDQDDIYDLPEEDLEKVRKMSLKAQRAPAINRAEKPKKQWPPPKSEINCLPDRREKPSNTVSAARKMFERNCEPLPTKPKPKPTPKPAPRPNACLRSFPVGGNTSPRSQNKIPLHTRNPPAASVQAPQHLDEADMEETYLDMTGGEEPPARPPSDTKPARGWPPPPVEQETYEVPTEAQKGTTSGVNAVVDQEFYEVPEISDDIPRRPQQRAAPPAPIEQETYECADAPALPPPRPPSGTKPSKQRAKNVVVEQETYECAHDPVPPRQRPGAKPLNQRPGHLAVEQETYECADDIAPPQRSPNQTPSVPIVEQETYECADDLAPPSISPQFSKQQKFTHKQAVPQRPPNRGKPKFAIQKPSVEQAQPPPVEQETYEVPENERVSVRPPRDQELPPRPMRDLKPVSPQRPIANERSPQNQRHMFVNSQCRPHNANLQQSQEIQGQETYEVPDTDTKTGGRAAASNNRSRAGGGMYLGLQGNASNRGSSQVSVDESIQETYEVAEVPQETYEVADIPPQIPGRPPGRPAFGRPLPVSPDADSPDEDYIEPNEHKSEPPLSGKRPIPARPGNQNGGGRRPPDGEEHGRRPPARPNAQQREEPKDNSLDKRNKIISQTPDQLLNQVVSELTDPTKAAPPPRCHPKPNKKSHGLPPPMPIHPPSSGPIDESEPMLDIHQLQEALTSPPPVGNKPKKGSLKKDTPSTPPTPKQQTPEDLLKSSPFYRGKIDRNAANESLNKVKKDGCFLVRDTDKIVGYSISIYYKGEIRHLQIPLDQKAKKYKLGSADKKFDTVPELISYYQKNSIELKKGGKTKLTVPCTT